MQPSYTCRREAVTFTPSNRMCTAVLCDDQEQDDVVLQRACRCCKCIHDVTSVYKHSDLCRSVQILDLIDLRLIEARGWFQDLVSEKIDVDFDQWKLQSNVCNIVELL
jgi:hypothetical protein